LGLACQEQVENRIVVEFPNHGFAGWHL